MKSRMFTRGRIVSVGAALAANAAFAANGYIVPWYANPAETNVAYDSSLVLPASECAEKLAAAQTAVSGDAALSGKAVVAWRMSHTSYFRPRAYALCDDGDLAAFTLTEDCAGVKWTTVLTAADLAAAAGVAEGLSATDMQVTDDGRIAFLRYGDAWKAVSNTPPVWELRIVDGNGDLVSDPDAATQILIAGSTDAGCAYITDGRRELHCWRENWTRLGIGMKGSSADGNAWKNTAASEVLDFSYGYAKLANEALRHDSRQFDRGHPYELFAYRPGYLGRTATVREPRIFIESPRLNYFYSNRGTWADCEEVVLDNATAQQAAYFTKYPECVRKLVVDLPGQTTFNGGWLANGGAPATRPQVLSETSFDDIGLASLTNLGNYAINGLAASGRLDLPAIRRFETSNSGYNSPLGQNHCLTEASLSAEGRTLEYVCDSLFYDDTALRTVTFGGVPGFAMKGSDIFRGCHSLQDVIFTGGVPAFDDVQYVFPDSAAEQLVFAVPCGSAEWQAKLDGNVVLLRKTEQDAFREAHPGRPVPHGIVSASVFKTHHPQYIAFYDRPKIISDSGLVITVR